MKKQKNNMTTARDKGEKGVNILNRGLVMSTNDARMGSEGCSWLHHRLHWTVVAIGSGNHGCLGVGSLQVVVEARAGGRRRGASE